MVLFSKEQRDRIRFFSNAHSNKTAIFPFHGGKDLKKGTFLAILKQAGIDINS